MKWVARIVLPAVVVAGVGLLGWAFWPKPIPVELAHVTSGTFIDAIEEDCRTRIRNRYEISTPVAGRVLRSVLEVGDTVLAGDTVAVVIPGAAPLLDPRTRAEQEQRVGGAEAEIAAAEADVERIRAAVVQAQAEEERGRVLADRGVMTRQELERRELATATSDRDLKAAEMRLHVAEHELEAARSLLESFANGEAAEQVLVTAPVKGVVLQISQTSEAAIPIGSSLLELGDPADLEVVCDVLTVDAVRMAAGSPVEIDRWGGSDILLGAVERIEPSGFTKVSALGVEEQRVHVIVGITSPREAWRSLGDGFRVSARIEVGRIDDATLAPAGAIFRRGQGWSAFAIEDGIAREKPVEVLGRSGNIVAIGDGLAVGDEVVTFPPEDLEDGRSVRDSLLGVFLQRKGNPHDIVFFDGPGPRLHHVAYTSGESHRLLHACDIAAQLGFGDNIERGPARHGPAFAMFVYFCDPDGHRTELFTAHYQTIDIDDEPVRWQRGDERLEHIWAPPPPRSWIEEATPFVGVPVESPAG